MYFRGFYLRMLTSRPVRSWKSTVPQDSSAKVIVDASILIGIELQVISSLDSNVLLRHNASPRFEIRRVEESSLIGCLGAVESASPHEVRDYWHQVKSAYPSKVSPSC